MNNNKGGLIAIHCGTVKFCPGNKWHVYELEKAKIARMNLSPNEYEKRIRELARKLEI